MSESDADRDTLPQPDWHQEWTDLTPVATDPRIGSDRKAADLPNLRDLTEDRGDESQTQSRPEIRRQKGRESRQEGQQKGQQGSQAGHGSSEGRRTGDEESGGQADE